MALKRTFHVTPRLTITETEKVDKLLLTVNVGNIDTEYEVALSKAEFESLCDLKYTLNWEEPKDV